MKIGIFNLIIVLFLFMGCQALFADDSPDLSMASDTSGWVARNGNRITLLYPSDINLKNLEGRLRSRWFSVSAVEKDLYTNPSYGIEKRIIARLESILMRTKQILAMNPSFMEIKIKVFRNRDELSQEYFRNFGSIQQYKSFYIHGLGTIYASMQDISDSVIAHEMAHAVIDNYFKVIPPEKIAELLTTYVDSHLERE